MKIRQKLFSGYGIVAMLAIFVGIFVVSSAVDIKYAVDRIALENIPEVRAATKSNHYIQMIKLNIKELLLLGLACGGSPTEEIDRAKVAVKSDIFAVQECAIDWVNAIKSKIGTTQESKKVEYVDEQEEWRIFSGYERDANSFIEGVNKVYVLFEEGKYKEALRLFEEEVNPPSLALQAKLDDLERSIYDEVSAKSDEIRAMVSRTIKILLIVGITIVLFTFGFGYFISGTISGSIIKLKSAVAEMGRGRLSVKIDIPSKDEIGALAVAFNKMGEDLDGFVKRERDFLVKTAAAEIEHRKMMELEAAYKDLWEAQEGMQHNYEMQAAIGKLLQLSLQNIPMEEMLKQFIWEITSVSWLTLESKGAIFLVEGDSGVLIMKAQRGLSPQLLSLCASVPFGKCLCGRAALSKEVVFTQGLDDNHEIRFSGMAPHGHYCIPIMSVDKKVLGVINLYIKPERYRDDSEKEFLVAVANVLAGIIERRRMDDSIKTAYVKLQETQDQLIQAEKLNAIGLLASGMAHEVKNPLGIVLQGINYLEGKISPDEKINFDVLAKIKEGIKRADDIASSLLGFSRSSKVDLHPEDMNSMLESSLELMKERFKDNHINVVIDIKKDMPKVYATKNRIVQVFVNILLNALQAMPKGGKLSVRSYFEAGEKAVIVEIEDTGAGIAKENLNKVFDPFFTTKAPGAGTGLGLYLSRDILNMHNATININSQPGEWTNVKIAFKINHITHPSK